MRFQKKVKFIQALEPKAKRTLEKQARKRSIGLQELIRAVVIPEWLEHQPKRVEING